MRTTIHAPLTGAARPIGSAGPDWSGADRGGLIRVGLHLLLAALPLLAISAHVFGLVRMQLSAALLVVPLATGVIALTIFAPHAGDRVLAHGFLWGMIGTAIYDVFRLDTVYMLHWWADFIPTMGTWITGDPDNKVAGAIVGYLWRYPGDGGGIGITFFALASAVGLHQRSRGVVVGTAVAFAVFPVWAGLIGTVWLASAGQTLMFRLTPTTITLSLIGHLIFGVIMGLGFWRSRSVQEHWPWAPLTGSQPAVLGPAFLDAAPVAAALPAGGRPGPVRTRSDRFPESATWRGAPARPTPGVTVVPAPESRLEPRPELTSGPTSGSLPEPAPARPGPITGSQPLPAVAPPPPAPAGSTGSTGDTGVPALPRPRDRGTPPGGVRVAGEAGGSPHTVSARTVAAPGPTPSTPPGGQSLDPHTWELWQRQMDTTVRGRRTHRARR